jgi:hypothetical protein
MPVLSLFMASHVESLSTYKVYIIIIIITCVLLLSRVAFATGPASLILHVKKVHGTLLLKYSGTNYLSWQFFTFNIIILNNAVFRCDLLLSFFLCWLKVTSRMYCFLCSRCLSNLAVQLLCQHFHSK